MAVNSIETKLEDARTRGQRWLHRLELLERQGGASNIELAEADRKAQFWMARHGALLAKAEARSRLAIVRRAAVSLSAEIRR